jgi:hypothetical protein
MMPGILVALRTSVRGGVEYERSELEADDAGRVTRWETTRFMENPAERKAAAELASKAAGLVSKLCIRTTFGLLCRTDREAELDAAVAEMRQTVTEWNQKAEHTFVSVSAIKGRIADNDEEAIRAIVAEARDLLDQMGKGLEEADVDQIRAAALRAKKLSGMMTEDSGDRINAALTAARQAAKAIVKRGDDLSNKVAAVTIQIERDTFNEARFSFLDMAEKITDELPAVDLQRTAALEIEGLDEVLEEVS